MQALAASGMLAHDKFMGTQHVLGGGGALEASPVEAVFALDEVPFGQLMSSVLKEWGMPMYDASSDTTAELMPSPRQPAAAFPASLPLRAPAPPPQRAPSAGGVVASMRCLDTAHARGCTECTAAPLDGEDGASSLGVAASGAPPALTRVRAPLQRFMSWWATRARRTAKRCAQAAAERPARGRRGAPPTPPAQQAVASPPGLRCLDPTHSRSCAECTAAPLEGEDGASRT